MRTVTVYALIGEDGSAYVGATADYHARIKAHMSCRDRTTREWMGGLRKLPEAVVLECVPANLACDAEVKWIASVGACRTVVNKRPWSGWRRGRRNAPERPKPIEIMHAY